MDGVEKRAMLVLLGEQKRLAKLLEEKRDGKEGGKEEMCQAIDELIEDGKEQGVKIGEQRMAELVKNLLEDGKADLITVVVSDEEQRAQLYSQYRL